jgi:hypothetical protein
MFGGEIGQRAVRREQTDDQVARRAVAADQPARTPINHTFWAAVGLDVVGAGLILYGIIENGNVGPYSTEAEHDRVRRAVITRNVVYGIGAAALLGGISIHIFF